MIFENDYIAVLTPPGPAANRLARLGWLRRCMHPWHDPSLPTLSLDDILIIIQEWGCICHRCGAQGGIAHVQIFEASGSYLTRTQADQRIRTRVR